MEKIKKERRFLKTLGKIGETLLQEVLIKVGSSLIKRIGGKKTLPSFLFLFISVCLFAQYPNSGNKQRLGYQTTGDGLVYRGRAADTVAIKSSGLNNAYFILDTVNNILYNYIKTKGGWKFSNGDTIIINNNFTQPVDSLFFNVGVPTNNVDTAKMRWDSDLATVVLGLNDNVPNELGFKNFWLVKNQTGATITKGSLVYANGTVGASGRITVAKFIANGSIDAKYLLGITAHNLSDGEDGYVISFGKIRQVNTDTFAAGAILYPSPTVAGVWTDVEPVAPNLDMPIGFCINSHVNNGTISIRVASGYALHELHDVRISSPVNNASLYYKSSESIWRDTTAALLVSDTASMLTNYLRSGIAASTYLPLSGGTLTGGLNIKAGNGNQLSLNNNGERFTQLNFGNNSVSKAIIWWDDNNKELVLLANGLGTGHLIIDSSGATSLSSTLGVTGATTLTGALTVNNATVLNEGSGDFDTRIESDGNANMVFVDASTDRVGIGTNAPTKTLEVNGTFNATGDITEGGLNVLTSADTASLSSRIDGKVSLNGDETINGSKSFNNQVNVLNRMTISGSVSGGNQLLGKNSSNNGVSDITLGTGLSITSNVLNANTTDTTSLSNRINLKYDKTGGTISGAVTLSTTTATPSALLGKDGSNVVGAVTTLAQTGLMTRGETTATTGSPSAVFTVTHGLGSTPTSVLITSAGIGGGNKILFEVYTKNSTTFSVQAWNYDGTEASGKSVKIYWLALK